LAQRLSTLRCTFRVLPIDPVTPTRLSYSPAVLRLPSWGLASSRSLAPQCSRSALPKALPSSALRYATPLLHLAHIAFSLTLRSVLQGSLTAECTASLSRHRSLREVIHLQSSLSQGLFTGAGRPRVTTCSLTDSRCHQRELPLFAPETLQSISSSLFPDFPPSSDVPNLR
jgi:hypothetical protein